MRRLLSRHAARMLVMPEEKAVTLLLCAKLTLLTQLFSSPRVKIGLVLFNLLTYCFLFLVHKVTSMMYTDA